MTFEIKDNLLKETETYTRNQFSKSQVMKSMQFIYLFPVKESQSYGFLFQ